MVFVGGGVKEGRDSLVVSVRQRFASGLIDKFGDGIFVCDIRALRFVGRAGWGGDACDRFAVDSWDG